MKVGDVGGGGERGGDGGLRRERDKIPPPRSPFREGFLCEKSLKKGLFSKIYKASRKWWVQRERLGWFCLKNPLRKEAGGEWRSNLPLWVKKGPFGFKKRLKSCWVWLSGDFEGKICFPLPKNAFKMIFRCC